MITINQLCCAGLGIGFVLACLVFIIWALCIVAALDREANGNEPTS